MKKIIVLFMVINIVFPSVYNTGDQISTAHQNVEFPVCFGDFGDNNLKLADLNGELNGGYYHVLYIDMAASW